MSDLKEYREFRNSILDFIRRDIEGPYDENEVIDEIPSTKYSVGILFPQMENLENSEIDDDNVVKTEEDVGTMDQTSAFYPSAAGVSFTVEKNIDLLSIVLRFGEYRKLKKDDCGKIILDAPGLKGVIEENLSMKDFFKWEDSKVTLQKPIEKHDYDILRSMAGENNQLKDLLYKAKSLYQYGWFRTQAEWKHEIHLDLTEEEAMIEGSNLKINVLTKPIPGTDKKIITCTVINHEKALKPKTSVDQTVYQLSLSVMLQKGKSFCDMNEKTKTEQVYDDTEEESLELLYRNKKVFALGHGISADWQLDEKGNATEVHTETIPSYTVPQMEFNIDSKERPINLSMIDFAFSKDSEIISDLTNLVDIYQKWIDTLENEISSLPERLSNIAVLHIQRCKISAKRMLEGIELLKTNADAMTAFKDSNLAMAMQRSHTLIQLKKVLPDEDKPMPKSYRDVDAVWRPFQIAFIIMNLNSMFNPESKDREIVDLIWFPTGGGKTEAYLGLTAFTIFSRRINNPEDYGGTAVIMRYTLRLLTSQQFQRACTLICACERIRQDKDIYREQRISVGLWLGSSSTPNNLAEASLRIAELQSSREPSGNPFQVINCPWCGTYLSKQNGRGVNSYRISRNPKKHLSIWCPNKQCDFTEAKNGLPVLVIDEDIYNDPPTLLFGTVDKFAMLPWKKDSSSIFALNKDNQNLSPSLIIQDELHLISGALGTIVGLFETAIDILSSKKGIKPKIVASTATIRRAEEQCMSLYARKVQQFPSPGIDATDSFFAREAKIDDNRPGRLYVGIMPSGKTATSLQVHLMADTIQSVNILEGKDSIKDAFWTQVIYCNSIRELGSSKTVIYDDVKERSKIITKRLGTTARLYTDSNITELTSRVSGGRIPEILRQLEVAYPSKQSIDVLLATNMISVGVDIDRFGLMVILGQPKTTSEYIQASSRIGRRYPGLVIAQLSPTKSRDRSHYEQFVKFHQSLYRYVEPTSVTPFSPPARDKALRSVFLTLLRHTTGLNESKDLKDYKQFSVKVNEVIREIIKRVDVIDPAEAKETLEELHAINSRIIELVDHSAGVAYEESANNDNIGLMKSPTDTRSNAEYRIPQSMRSADSECYVTVDYS